MTAVASTSRTKAPRYNPARIGGIGSAHGHPARVEPCPYATRRCATRDRLARRARTRRAVNTTSTVPPAAINPTPIANHTSALTTTSRLADG
jgi:hypothetical protein